jgi:hypothetical protein
MVPSSDDARNESQTRAGAGEAGVEANALALTSEEESLRDMFWH